MNDPAERAAARIASAELADDFEDFTVKDIANIIRAEFGELMPCGHPQASRVDNPDPRSHLDRIYREQIAKGMLNVEQADSLKIHYFCTACEREAAAVEAAREECARLVESQRMPVTSLHHWEEAAAAIRSLNLTGALDRLIAGAYEAAACRINELECQDGRPSYGHHNAEVIRALAPADAQRALDRKVNEARLEQTNTVKQMYDDGFRTNEVYEYTLKRIAELKAALEKP